MYQYFDGESYEGSLKDGQFSGYGVYTWPDGKVYKGEYQNGHHHGQGLYQFKDRSSYEGSSKDGQYSGLMEDATKASGRMGWLMECE